MCRIHVNILWILKVTLSTLHRVTRTCIPHVHVCGHSHSNVIYNTIHTHTYTKRTADPYAAAMEFLQVNSLPDMYLDQVAEFIVQNAGEYQGPIASGPADPFTG